MDTGNEKNESPIPGVLEETQERPGQARLLQRFAASIIDFSLIAGIVLVFWIAWLKLFMVFCKVPLKVLLYSGAFKFAFSFTIIMLLLFSLAAAWLYHVLSEGSSLQGTLGKIAMKIKVTKTDGSTLDIKTVTIRFACKIAAFVFYPLLLLGLTTFFLGEGRQMFHDIAAKTLVTDSKRSGIDELL